MKISRRLIKWGGFLALMALALFSVDRFVPNQHLPWRALDIHAPTGFATDLQLMRLSLSPSSTCSATIESARDYRTRPAERYRPNDECGWNVARHVDGSASAGLDPLDVTMQCPLAVGLYIWMREVDDLAEQHLGSGVKYVNHYSAYSCRRQRGNGSGKWSEHAYANAFDISGFRLEDGREITLLNDWNGAPDERAFLRAARKEACKIFRVTLSPDFNDAHADHFHVDMGPTTSCR